MGWVWMAHPDGEPVRFPDDPAVIAQQEALGLQQVDEPGASPESGDVEPDEVDVHGIGWLRVIHDETGGTARIPNQPGVLDDWRTRGWRLIGEPADAEAEAFDNRTVAELKAEIDRRNFERIDLADPNDIPPILKTGTKQELIDRLAEDDARQAPVEPTEPEEQ